MSLTRQDIRDHYCNPRVKETIIRCSADEGSTRAGNYDFTGWYKYYKDKRQLFNLETDYNQIINKVQRSLYWTLNFFDNHTFDIQTNNPDERLGTGKETESYTLGIDIDIKEGYDITNGHARLSLEECVTFFHHELSQYLDPGNIYAAFSGGGAYVYLHHNLFKLPVPEDGDYDLSEREDSWAVLRAMYQLLMEDISEKFFQKNPDAANYVKVDFLNNDKRLFKTIYSIHKKHDYAVIPLKPPYFKIDLEEATLPLSDTVLEYGMGWYKYCEDLEGRNNLLRKLQEYEWVAKSLNNISKITINNEKVVSKVKIELNDDIICPVMKAILSDDDWGDGTHRRIVTGTIYLAHLGWDYQEIYEYIGQKASHWEDVKGISTLVRYWMKVQMPSYNTLYGKGKFPIPGFNEFSNKLPPQPVDVKDSVRYTLRKIEERGLSSKLGDVRVDFRFKGDRKYDYNIIEDGHAVYTKLKYDRSPIEIGPKTEIYTQLKEYANQLPGNPDKHIKDLLMDLDQQRKDYYLIKDFKSLYIDSLRNYKDVASMDEAKKALEDLDNILIYVGCVADWMAAGERLNVLFGFICAVNLLVFGDPINFIATGMAGSGKTAIEQTIFDMLPAENVSWEKKPTVAAIFRRAEEDPRFYDKKIVYMGDLGGDKDMESSEEARNIFKELNSDGKMSRPVSAPGEDTWVTVDLLLEGKPALFYTTVHDYKLNDQEVSRGFVISPRTDNTVMVNVMHERLRAIKGKTLKQHNRIKDCELSKIRNIVRFLMGLGELTVVNPYPDVLQKMISGSPFIKRDYQKIMMLAEAITVLNYNDRKKWETEDGTYIITSKQDIMFLYQLLEGYMESIHLNVPNSLLDLHKQLEEKYDYDMMFTLAEVRKKIDVRAHPKIDEELRKLAAAGLLSVGDEKGAKGMNQYTVVSLKPTKINPEEDLVLSDIRKSVLSYEHSEEFVNFVVEHENAVPILDIHEWGWDGYKPPAWEYSEPRKDIKRVKLGKDSVKEDVKGTDGGVLVF